MTDDEQEAKSLRYARSLSILALSSGKFAVFLPFDNETGMPLAKIGDWAELEEVVREYKEPAALTERKKMDSINLEELFGPDNGEQGNGER